MSAPSVRLDMLAARIYQQAVAPLLAEEGPYNTIRAVDVADDTLEQIANAAWFAAWIFGQVSQRRDPSTGNLAHEGLPEDDGAELHSEVP